MGHPRTFRLLLCALCVLCGKVSAAPYTAVSDLRLTGVVTPAQITSDQDDYAPTGFAGKSVLRLASDATRTLTGLGTGAAGRVVYLHNVGAADIVLADEGSGSTAANRFALPAAVTVAPDVVAELQYDATSSRWRLVGVSTGGGGGGSVTSVFGRSGTVVAVSGDYTAAQVTNTPTGSIAATTVQAAIDELASEKAAAVHTHTIADVTGLQAALDGKQPLEATLTGLAALAPTADQMIYATGADNFATTVLTATARTLLDDTTTAAMRTTLGAQAADGDLAALAAVTGTNSIYYRSATDTWSAVTIGANLTFSGGTLSASGGGGGSPGGASTQVQFNDGGAFGGDAGMVYNKTTDTLTIAGSISALDYGVSGGQVGFSGASGIGFQVISSYGFGWTPGANWFNGVDTAFFRGGAGVIDVTAGSSSSWSTLRAGQVHLRDSSDAAFLILDAGSTLTTARTLSILTGDANRALTLSGDAALGGAVTASGFTMSTARLLGRSTASTGAIEEITIGANLTLSGGTLSASGGGSGYATIQEEGSGLTQRATLNFVGGGITAADDAGNTRTNVTLGADLNALEALGSTGIAVRTGSDSWAQRTITGTANQISATNGDGVSGNPTLSLPTDLQVPGAIALVADISPTQITADQDDYSPSGLSTAAVLRLSTDAARNLTGLAGGADGRWVKVLNVGSSTLTLVEESTSSTAANRFLGGTITLAAGGATDLIYDATVSRWRIGRSFAIDATSLTLNASGQLQRAALSGVITATAGGNTTSFADATITGLAALSPGADTMIYATATDTFASTTLTATARSLLDDTTTAAMRTTLGLAIGSDVQGYDAELAQIAGLADPNADRLVFWDDSAGAYTHLTLGTNLSITGTTINASGGGGGLGYTLTGACLDTALADSATYYVGSAYGNNSQQNAGRYVITVPVAGTITGWSYAVRANTPGTAEDITFAGRLNGSTTVGSTTLDLDVGTVRTGTVTGLSQAVSAGDTWEWEITVPSMATNPSATMWFCVYVQ